MLAIDCLVGGLLLSSIGVNILALGAFWVTPSLRTTANRFVINLLIVNLVCCIILGPSLLLNAFTGKAAVPTPLPAAELPAAAATPILYEPTTGGEYGSPAYTTTTVALAYQQPSSTVAQPNRTRIVRCSKNGTMGSGDDGPSNCDRQEEQNDEDEEETPFIRTSRIHPGPGVDALHPNLTLTKIRCWGLDLVVALGALSVLLVVGDTWCAITDPLRYHSRISELKAWAFIIASWALGIAFGIASGFRGDQKYVTLFKNRLTAEEHLNISEDLYNTIFSYAYFVIVILIPFALVCAMYWRIFSEARESGQRMRQNGSSPLLQSALNLVSAQKQCHAADKHSIPHHHQPRDSCLKPLLQQSPAPTPTHKPIQQQQLDASLERPDRSPQVVQIATPTSGVAASLPSVLKSPLRPDRNHNSILMHQQLPAESSASGPIPTHSSPPPAASAGLGKVRRNHSAGRLVSFCQEEPTELPVAGLRQVHSTPNFQKYSGGEFESLGTHHILSLPAVHVPPKALSYMTSIRHRLSNASSLFKYREESRAARISILVIIMFLVSYLPYGILVLMQGHVDLIIVSDQALLAIFTVVIANLSSPFIFAYRNKRVRRGVKRLLGIDKKTNERLQKLTTSNTHYNNHPPGQHQPQQQQQQHGNYGANITLANAVGQEEELPEVIAHKSAHKVRIAGSQGAGGLARSNSSCKYLTPNHAAAVAVANGYIVEFERYPSDELNSLCIQKKSILKRVCDSSRKWGCNFATNSCTSNDEQTEV
ncbi:AGAP002566-PA [Anopheles gambiae str. PEST]|uniref:AGAP002566-PA n=1 Tax=Anopheles gambiae TaxID=7165 RepID=Q7PR04_ANOGA|nr:AGAP002566-PA [Anopheles gambiae str. PEST]